MVKSSDILRINHLADEIRYLALFSRLFDCFTSTFPYFAMKKDKYRQGAYIRCFDSYIYCHPAINCIIMFICKVRYVYICVIFK